MSYSSASNVAAYCRDLLGNLSMFPQSGSQTPHIRDIQEWLSSGCALIETAVAGEGYSTPISSGTTAYGVAEHLNTIFAVAHAELSQAALNLAPGERTRGQVFYEMFWDELDRFTDSDLSRQGVDRSSTGQMFVGGINKARLRTVKTNTAMIRARFERDMFKFSETLEPVGYLSASE